MGSVTLRPDVTSVFPLCDFWQIARSAMFAGWEIAVVKFSAYEGLAEIGDDERFSAPKETIKLTMLLSKQLVVP